MAKYWKTEILPEVTYLWKNNPREVCGVTVDPVVFLSMYMKRFLYRMNQEGMLPVPGTYSVEFKVFKISFQTTTSMKDIEFFKSSHR